MAAVDARATCVLTSGAFLIGVVVGWKLHAWRVQYLKNKRDYYAGKAFNAQKQMEQ